MGEIGQRIKEARVAAKMTQAEVAEAMGVHQTTISQWETGLQSPKVTVLRRLAVVLNCGVYDLMADDPVERLKAVDLVFQDKMTEMKRIRIELGLPEVLAQLAEEAAELSQSALKLRRVLDGHNPTPVTLSEAEEHLQEEFADVLLSMEIVGVDVPCTARTISAKCSRWIERLEDKDD